VRRNGRSEAAVTALGHVGYSVAASALYPLARPLLPGPTLLKGALFGVGLRSVGYLGWVPAAGLIRPATREPAGRNWMNVGAHVVGGATTALVAEGLLRRRRRGNGESDGASSDDTA
jgi:hypothetical protein